MFVNLFPRFDCVSNRLHKYNWLKRPAQVGYILSRICFYGECLRNIDIVVSKVGWDRQEMKKIRTKYNI